jgi:hypothetical protein
LLFWWYAVDKRLGTPDLKNNILKMMCYLILNHVLNHFWNISFSKYGNLSYWLFYPRTAPCMEYILDLNYCNFHSKYDKKYGTLS